MSSHVRILTLKFCTCDLKTLTYALEKCGESYEMRADNIVLSDCTIEKLGSSYFIRVTQYETGAIQKFKEINSAVSIDKSSEKTIEETIFAQSARVTIIEQTGNHPGEADNVRLAIDQKEGEIIIIAPDEPLGCELLNMNGQVIRTSPKDRLGVSGLPTGIYFLRIRFERNVLTKIVSVR